MGVLLRLLRGGDRGREGGGRRGGSRGDRGRGGGGRGGGGQRGGGGGRNAVNRRGGYATAAGRAPRSLPRPGPFGAGREWGGGGGRAGASSRLTLLETFALLVCMLFSYVMI